MKLLSLSLSLITLVILTLSTLGDANDKNKTNSVTVNFDFKKPLTLSEKLLPAEVKWNALIKEKENKEAENNQSIEKNNLLKNAVKIGDNNYKLFGVFDNKQSLFIVLINKDNIRLKLALGDTLPGNFTLSEVNTNTIVFSHNNERVEYKLFEPKKYVEK